MNIPLVSYLGSVPAMAVKLGGHDATVLFDTAGGLTVLTPQGVQKAGCQPWGRMSGFRMRGDRLDMQRCNDVALRMGDKLWTVPAVGVWDFSKLLPPNAPPLDGSVALDAFAGQTVTIDLSHHLLTVETPQSAKQREAHAVEVPMRLAREVGGASITPMVALPTPKGTLWFELDCGSDAEMIVNRPVAEALGLSPDKRGQTTKLNLAKGLSLDARANVTDLVVDGNLGAPLLRQMVITIDLANQRLWLAPAAASDHQG